MRFLLPKTIALLISFLVYCGYNTNKKTTISSDMYTLTVKRGGYHNDMFQLIGNSIFYFPDSTDVKTIERFNVSSVTPLEKKVVDSFFSKLESERFWTLNERYRTDTSCSSSIEITLEHDGRSKTVFCEDFGRDCPDLIKYIDQSIVVFEGNDLKWTFLPG